MEQLLTPSTSKNLQIFLVAYFKNQNGYIRDNGSLTKDLIRFDSLELRGSIHFVLYLDLKFDYKFSTSNLKKNCDIKFLLIFLTK